MAKQYELFECGLKAIIVNNEQIDTWVSLLKYGYSSEWF